MFDPRVFNQQFNAERLERIVADSTDIKTKLFENPIPELTYEERYKLRQILTDVAVVTRLVRAETDVAVENNKKESIIDRIFKK